MTLAPGTPRFTIITGLSGAGRSEAAKNFEDLGYFVVDNLPPALIERLASLVAGPGAKVKDIALVVDVRGGEFFPELEKALSELRDRGIPYRILFLEASDQTIVRRFEATRRRHPLAPAERVIDGIKEERALMAGLREQADLVIDTTEVNVHGLRDKIRSFFVDTSRRPGMAVNVISFGYKHGIPLDADLVFDVRFLPNPHWIEELRPLTGLNRRVRGYVLSQEAAKGFLARIRDLLDFLVPGYVSEGRHYLTIAVGCTGGHHRSVVIADEIARFLQEKGYPSTVVHRDVEKE
ncbi:MAG TPA: RNase adapter RapZ [Actinomycetota bacterium]|nr:RNase adapter RapZ [Actinomycetota bacterium]